MMMFSRD